MRGGGGNRARDRARGITLVKEIRCGVMGFRTIYCLSTKFEHRRTSLLFPLSMGSTLPLSVDTDMKWGEEQTAVVKVSSLFLPNEPITVRYASNGRHYRPSFSPCLPWPVPSFPPSLTSCPIPSKFIYLPSELCFFFFLPRKCLGRSKEDRL